MNCIEYGRMTRARAKVDHKGGIRCFVVGRDGIGNMSEVLGRINTFR